MATTDSSALDKASPRRKKWFAKALTGFLCVGILVLIWYTNAMLTARFTEDTRQSAKLQQASNAGAIESEVRRYQLVPLLLARDPSLITALRTSRFGTTSQELMAVRAEIGAQAITLTNTEGLVVASTERHLLGESLGDAAPVVGAYGVFNTVFTLTKLSTPEYRFTFSRVIRDEAGGSLGVIKVDVDLAKLEARWRQSGNVVLVVNSAGQIILATHPDLRGKSVTATVSQISGVSEEAEPTDIFASTGELGAFGRDGILRTDARIPFESWRIITFTTLSPVREKVNAALALEITALALLLLGVFFVLNRRERKESQRLEQEGAELRRLNARLNREVAERERVQETLKDTELSLEQKSKLAALGEMSAAVSHELNQPLAAMKTYLAGAKLLLKRQRFEETLSSFQRVDDLIERMGAITRQLKSYARQGGDEFQEVDLRDAIAGALSVMRPQLKQEAVKYTEVLPDQPVVVMADKLRLEQVLINLIRNAMDEMKGLTTPHIEIMLTHGSRALISVRDNGPGIADLDGLFEPFYTTKKPGEGLGLGLAISSGIINDLKGRLSARNAPEGGAVFEISLPIHDKGTHIAAE